MDHYKKRNNESLDIERKKASQIFHYLMERKSEVDYTDPFDLLRNMNDVLVNYEPKKLNSTTIEVVTDEQLPQAVVNNTMSNSFKKPQYKGGSNSFYVSSNQTATTQWKKGADSSSISNNDYSYNQHQSQEVQLPQIISKQGKQFQPETKSSKGFRTTKTFLMRKEDKILDIHNIPEVTQMYDNLDLKYEKIKKLKEEFNDIKCQFGLPSKQEIQPKRHELKTRDCVITDKKPTLDKVDFNDDNTQKPQRSKTSNVPQNQVIKVSHMRHLFHHNGKENTLNTTQNRPSRVIDSERRGSKPLVGSVVNKQSMNQKKSSLISFGKSTDQIEGLKLKDNDKSQNKLEELDSTTKDLFVNTGGNLKTQQLSIQKVRSEALERFQKLYPRPPKDGNQNLSNKVYRELHNQQQKSFSFVSTAHQTGVMNDQKMMNKQYQFNSACKTATDELSLMNLDSLPLTQRSYIDENHQSTQEEVPNFKTVNTDDKLNERILEPIGEEESQLHLHQPRADVFSPPINQKLIEKPQSQQVHAGVSLYEQYKQNQIKQMKMLKRKKRKEMKKSKKNSIAQSVESIYMREAIIALIHAQNSNTLHLKRQSQQINGVVKKSRKGIASQMRTKSSTGERPRDPNQILDNRQIYLQHPSRLAQRKESQTQIVEDLQQQQD